MGLPDEVRVFPAHGAGSACGKNLSTERQSTIGEQRAHQLRLPADERGAVPRPGHRAASPPPPATSSTTRCSTARARELFDHDAAARARSTAAEVAEARAAGAVRGRRPRPAGVRRRAPARVGQRPRRRPVRRDRGHGRRARTSRCVVIAPQDREEEVVVRLARIGFDQVVGYLPRAGGRLPRRSAPTPTRASRLTAPQLREALDRHRAAGGARRPQRRRTRRRAPSPARCTSRSPSCRGGSTRCPPTGRSWCYCAGGYRSSVAASLLRTAGLADVSDLLGGYGAWRTMLDPAAA